MDPLALTLIQSILLILSGTGMTCISIAMLNSRMKIKKQSRHHFSGIYSLKKQDDLNHMDFSVIGLKNS